MEKEKINEIITQLKAVKKEKEYSYQRIANMTEEIGDPVSLSTVRRVFTEDAHTFRWDTIKPIATVLLGVGFETPKPDSSDPEQGERYYAVIEGLKAVVEAKGELLAQKDKNIEYLKTEMYRYRKLCAISGCIIAALLLVIIAALIIDKANPNAGFFWLDEISHFFQNTAGAAGEVSTSKLL